MDVSWLTWQIKASLSLIGRVMDNVQGKSLIFIIFIMSSPCISFTYTINGITEKNIGASY